MTFEEMEKLKKEIYGDKPMTTENSRRVIGPIVPIDQFFEDMTPEERESYKQAKIDSLPVVLGNIDPTLLDTLNNNPRANCYHDWGNPEDDWNGVYKCKKCGKYSA